jgi:hypothetical protein
MKSFMRKVSLIFMFMGIVGSGKSYAAPSLASLKKAEVAVIGFEAEVGAIDFSNVSPLMLFNVLKQACFSGSSGLKVSDLQFLTAFYLCNQKIVKKMPLILSEFMFAALHSIAEIIREQYKKESFCQEVQAQVMRLIKAIMTFISKNLITLPTSVAPASSGAGEYVIKNPALAQQINDLLSTSQYDGLIVYLTDALPETVKTESIVTEINAALRNNIKRTLERHLLSPDISQLLNFFKSDTYARLLKNYKAVLGSALEQMPVGKKVIEAARTSFESVAAA